MIEFDVDMGYLLEEGELDCVVLNDENGEHEPMEFVPEDVIDSEYEAKMDALLCRLTNGKWSKSRAYDLDFMVSCIDEEYEDAYDKERAKLGSGIARSAEQIKRIHEIIEKHWHDLSDEYDMPEATALPEYSYDWQAIADELNVELEGEREKALEELVQDWQELYENPDYGDCIRLRKRMQELGIEVIDE